MLAGVCLWQLAGKIRLNKQEDHLLRISDISRPLTGELSLLSTRLVIVRRECDQLKREADGYPSSDDIPSDLTRRLNEKYVLVNAHERRIEDIQNWIEEVQI
jgi:hypothetical protein